MSASARRRTTTVTTAMLVSIVLVLAVARACGPDPFDRAGAVEGVLASYAGRLTRDQAACYVDRVVAELGARALDADPPAPEHVPRLTRIRTDCIGVAGLGTVPSPLDRPGAEAMSGPRAPGDDPDLDQLHEACAAGSGAACDQLFDEAPLGSEYEDFALTCGGRISQFRCADKYPEGLEAG